MTLNARTLSSSRGPLGTIGRFTLHLPSASFPSTNNYHHLPLPTTRYVDRRTRSSILRHPHLRSLLKNCSAPDEVQSLPLPIVLCKAILLVLRAIYALRTIHHRTRCVKKRTGRFTKKAVITIQSYTAQPSTHFALTISSFSTVSSALLSHISTFGVAIITLVKRTS